MAARLVGGFAVLVAALVGCAAPAIADPTPPVDNTMPAQTYPQTYSEQQFIRMDDGVELAATISFPSQNGSAAAPGRFPTVLELTPYGRNGVCGCDSASDFATRGFAFAVVDTRGTGDSGGNLDGNYFSPREAQDGYDLVQYLGTQPWSNGRVGMAGGSYLGIDQYKTAETDPSHLAAIAPDEAFADEYNDAAYPGGILSLSFDAQYLAVQPGAGTTDPETDPSMIPQTLINLQQQANSTPIAFAALENVYDDSFWQERNPITEVSKINVPTFVEDGWRDAFEAGNIRMFQALESRRGLASYLNVGPCTHKGCGAPEAPTDNPPNQDDVEAQELHFFQHYLIGMNGAPLPPRVRIYDQQAGRYIDTTAWPPPQIHFAREYVGAGTRTSLSAGTISPSCPKAGRQTYFTNPSSGFSMSLDEQGTVAASPYLPVDQRTEEAQGITWRTATLTRPLTFAGPIAVHLVASSTATNTDWFLKIADVAPDGSENIVTEGQLRASLRALAPGSTATEPLETLASPEPLTPGKFYDFEIAIAPTGYVFEPGHRLQLRLTSGNLPNALPGTIQFNASDPAASTFTPLPPAFNTVRYGGADGTSIVIPVYGGGPVSTQRCALATRAVTKTRAGKSHETHKHKKKHQRRRRSPGASFTG